MCSRCSDEEHETHIHIDLVKAKGEPCERINKAGIRLDKYIEECGAIEKRTDEQYEILAEMIKTEKENISKYYNSIRTNIDISEKETLDKLESLQSDEKANLDKQRANQKEVEKRALDMKKEITSIQKAWKGDDDTMNSSQAMEKFVSLENDLQKFTDELRALKYRVGRVLVVKSLFSVDTSDEENIDLQPLKVDIRHIYKHEDRFVDEDHVKASKESEDYKNATNNEKGPFEFFCNSDHTRQEKYMYCSNCNKLYCTICSEPTCPECKKELTNLIKNKGYRDDTKKKLAEYKGGAEQARTDLINLIGSNDKKHDDVVTKFFDVLKEFTEYSRDVRRKLNEKEKKIKEDFDKELKEKLKDADSHAGEVKVWENIAEDLYESCECEFNDFEKADKAKSPDHVFRTVQQCIQESFILGKNVDTLKAKVGKLKTACDPSINFELKRGDSFDKTEIAIS